MDLESPYRIVESDADVAGMPPFGEDMIAVRVVGPLSDEGYRRLARPFDGRPDVELWINHRAEGLEFLVHFGGLRHLSVQSLELASWEGIRHVGDSLERLHMRDEALRTLSIAPLGDLPKLRSLSLIGPIRHHDTLARLIGLEHLSLRSVTLPDLSPLLPMDRLQRLYLGLGGTTDLSLLPDLGALEDLELWRIRGLRDVSMLAAIPRLRSLRLESMSAITQLPSFAGAAQLRSVALCAMKGISDLRPIASAPSLEELILSEMPLLDLESFRPLVGHPTLRRGIWGLANRARNHDLYRMLPVGMPPADHPDFGAWVERERSEAGGPP